MHSQVCRSLWLCPARIVCVTAAAETPSTGGIEVDVNGKLGHSPPNVQFTYQVSVWASGPLGASCTHQLGRLVAAEPGEAGSVLQSSSNSYCVAESKPGHRVPQALH